MRDIIKALLEHQCTSKTELKDNRTLLSMDKEPDTLEQIVLSWTVSTIRNEKPVQQLHEFTWVGRIFNGIHVLPPVRDQKGENRCTLCASLGTVEFLIRFKFASLHPPIECNVDLSLQKLLEDYDNKFLGIEEEKGEKSKEFVRLENVLELIQTIGAICESDDKVHMISSYARFYDSQKHGPEVLETAVQQLKEGNTFIGTFNSSYLKTTSITDLEMCTSTTPTYPFLPQ